MSLIDYVLKKVKKGSFFLRVFRHFSYKFLDYTEVIRYGLVIPLVNCATVLDVGAGIGRLSWNLRKKYPKTKVVSVESDESVCKWHDGEIPLLIADGLNLPFKSNSFDTVVSTDVLEHIPPKKRSLFIKELVRVSRKRIILTFPFEHVDVQSVFCKILPNFLIPNWLSEHDLYGLPSKEQIEPIFKKNNIRIVSRKEAIGSFAWAITIIQHSLLIPAPIGLLKFLQRFDSKKKTWVCYCLEKVTS
jgi:SAM-dependent methyltransferase